MLVWFIYNNMDKTLLISIDEEGGTGKKKSPVRNKLERVDRFRSFETLFSNTLESLEPILSDNMKIYISPTLTRKDEVEANKRESLLLVSQLFEAKSIYFLIKCDMKKLDAEVSGSSVERNAFQIMMAPPNRRLGDMVGVI